MEMVESEVVMTDLDLKNLLASFGISDEDAEKIDQMIDTTIDLHLGEVINDLPVHGNSRRGEVLSHGRDDLLQRED